MVTHTIQFEDAEQLEAWLRGKPVDWSQAIAVRAALRVFPLVFPEGGETQEKHSVSLQKQAVLQGFRALFVAWVNLKAGLSGQVVTADKTSDATDSAAENIRAHGGNMVRALFAAADAITSIAAVAEEDADTQLPGLARDVVRNSAEVADKHGSLIEESVTTDCRWLDKRGTNAPLINQPLWLDDVREDPNFQANFPPWVRERFDRFTNLDWVQSGPWKLIIAWYRAILPNDRNAKPRSLWGKRADIEIATQPDKFWDREPEEVLAAIKAIVERDPAGGQSAVKNPPADKSIEDEKPVEPDPNKPVDSENQRDTEAEFLSDHPDAMVDHLDRAAIALQLAGRINQIWDTQNPVKEVRHGPAGYVSALWTGRWKRRWNGILDTGFVVHLDAPWGGGKTNFASYVTRILNPWRDAEMPQWLDDLDLPGDADWMARYRRPWLVVNFNAWKHQHVDPPWWTFAETIRRQCMQALWSETNQREVGSFPDPLPQYDYSFGPVHFLSNVGFWIRERVWRLQLGSAMVPVVVAALTFGLVYAMYRIGLVSLDENDNLVFGGGLSALAIAALGSLFGGVATIRGIVDYVAKNLFSGTPEAARQFELGSADPLERFRQHFASTVEDFGRPIVVVVDDLDRCSPKYVVDLVRGMQTVMVSPRIVYLLLGDRDWIEKAFAESHKAMAAIDVGPEHSFGGRFVEKAIQMSFVLPDMDPERRTRFTEAILGKTPADAGRAKQGVAETVLSDLVARQAIDLGTLNLGQVLGTGNFRDREQAAETLIKQVRDTDLTAEVKTAFEADFSTRLARKAATDRSVEKETGHMLVGLASLLPGNPRQIKRIINTITVMQQVARLNVEDFRPLADDVKWQMLARWVVVMIEWPQTWYTLTKYPGIMDWVLPHRGKTPNSEDDKKLAAYAAQINNNEPVKKLLLMPDPSDGWEAKPITSGDIRWLARIMPATSGGLLVLPQKKKNAAE